MRCVARSHGRPFSLFQHEGAYAITENEDRLRDVVARAGGTVPERPESKISAGVDPRGVRGRAALSAPQR